MNILNINIPLSYIEELFFSYSENYESDFILEIATDKTKIFISTLYINIPDININIHQAIFESSDNDVAYCSNLNQGYLFKNSIDDEIISCEIGSGVVVALNNLVDLDIENLLCNLVVL